MTFVPCGGEGSDEDVEILVLCDDDGAGTVTEFLRRVTTVDGVVTDVTDTELDGVTSYAPVGTVTADCEAPCEATTPIATSGLCLADGTPIAVVTTRDCDGTVITDGWINLTTGAFTAGAAPGGAVACGEPRNIQVSGVFCDIDAAGDVVGLVLIEYQYGPDGSITSVTLLDATTGDPYTIQGELTVCPAGVEQPDADLIELCDTAADGTSVAFVRDYHRDENNAIVGFSDYDLDGNPYAPTGTVGICQDLCRNTSTLLVCDLPTDGDPDPVVTDTDPVPYQPLPGTEPVAGGAAALWSGGTLNIPPDNGPAPDGFPQHLRSLAATVQATRPVCDTGMATVTASMRTERTGPDDGCGGTGHIRLLVGGAEAAADGVRPRSVPVGTVNVLTVTAQVPAAELAAGNVALYGNFETYHRAPGSCPGGSNPDGARIGGWDIDQFEIDVAYDQEGCAEQVFANVVTDCETGEVLSVTYTTPDGQPYTPTGEIGECVPVSPQPEPCRDCETVTLCDSGDQTDVIPGDGTTSGTLSNGVGWSTDTSMSAIGTPEEGWFLLQASPPNPQTFTFDTPVSVEFQLTTDGPSIEVSPGAEPVELNPNHAWDPGTRQLTSTSGDIADRSVFATTGTTTEIGLLAPPTGDASAFAGAFAVTLEGENATFLRHICYDCGGQVLSVTDTELDATTEYIPIGEVGPCSAGTVAPPAEQDCCPVALGSGCWDDGTDTGEWVTLIDPDDDTVTGPIDVLTGDPVDPADIVDCADEACANQILERCGCDDVNGDGSEIETYTELWSIDPCGGAEPELLGSFLDGDLTQPYEPANPVDCPGPVASAALRSQHFDVADGAPWTPAEATGTITSVTYTIITGTASVTDSDGTVIAGLPAPLSVTWNHDEEAALDPPQEIAAEAGGRVLVVWTEL